VNGEAEVKVTTRQAGVMEKRFGIAPVVGVAAVAAVVVAVEIGVVGIGTETVAEIGEGVVAGVALLDRIGIPESSVVGAGILVRGDRILREIEGRRESASRPGSAGMGDDADAETVLAPGADPAVGLVVPAVPAVPVPATVVAAVVQRVVLVVPEEFDVLVVGFVVPSSSRSCIGCC